MKNTEDQKKIALVTFCMDDWGGSEELWARSVPMLKKDIVLTVYKAKFNRSHPEIINLIDQNIRLVELDPVLSVPQKIRRKANYYLQKISLSTFRDNHSLYKFHQEIEISRPQLVIIAQGINFDGLTYAHQCYLLKIPYVIIAQKAVDFYWPYHTDRAYMKITLLNAQKCYFVSHHNKRLTEEQFGIRLPNSEVIFNPIKTKTQVMPFPSTDKGFNLACVARLFIIDKGQDILLRILSKDKWRNRPVSVSFIGTGLDEEGLKEMANLLSVKNIQFIGFQQSIEDIWSKHHALILPSRSEGLPLSMIEAMALGRTVIVSTAGGNSEIIVHGVNGFIGEANEKDFEKLMDEAWEMRDKWHEIGKAACLHIENHIPTSPETVFANSINELLS